MHAATAILDGLTIPGVADLGASGLLVIAIVMIFTGRLVPASQVKMLTRELELWRESSLEQQRQITALIATGHITLDVLRAIPSSGPDPPATPPAPRPPPGGDA